MLQRECVHVAGGRVDWYAHCANQYGGSSKLSKWNLQKLQSHYWLVYPADVKSAWWRKTCTSVFAAALLRLANAQNQPRQPSRGEWIRNAESSHTTEFYSAVKENEMMTVMGKWMELEIIVLSKASQMQTDTARFL